MPLFTDISILSCVEVCILRVIVDPVSREKPIYFRREVCSVGMISFLHAQVFALNVLSYLNRSMMVMIMMMVMMMMLSMMMMEKTMIMTIIMLRMVTTSQWQASMSILTPKTRIIMISLLSNVKVTLLKFCIWIRTDTRSLSVAVADPVEGETILEPEGLKMI